MHKFKKWATPLTIGSSFLMAVTGLLMFYHVKLGAIKVAHEWGGWAMIVAAIFHVLGNLKPFLNYFKQKLALFFIGLFVVTTVAVMFIPAPERGGPGGAEGRRGPPPERSRQK